MIILDSDVWIAFLNTQDSQHKKALKVFSQIEKSTDILVVPEYVVLEVVTVLRRLVSAKMASLFIKTLTQDKYIHVLPSNLKLFKSACSATYNTAQPKLSFTDITLLELSHKMSVTTFDRALARAITNKATTS